jgi:hypothetical protein
MSPLLFAIGSCAEFNFPGDPSGAAQCARLAFDPWREFRVDKLLCAIELGQGLVV